MRKKVCMITDSYWPAIGGVEQWVHGIASHLSRRYAITVITHAPGAPFGFRFILFANTDKHYDDIGSAVVAMGPHGVQRFLLMPLLIWHMPLFRKLYPKRLHDALYFFYKTAFLKKMEDALSDADIVHCFSTGYLAVCAALACRRRGIPCIQSPPVHFGKWGDSPLLMKTYAEAQAIACLSNDLKNRFMQRMPPSAPISVIPVPVSIPVSLKKPGVSVSKPFVLFLGRRETHKGLALLLDAFKTVTLPVTLAIAGPGERLVRTDRRVVDCGVVDEAQKHWLLEHCALLCVPSMEESFGIVYAEAMAHAKPIVALDIAPVNELVANGLTGLLTPPGRKDLLSKAIAALVSDEGLAQKMGLAGQKRFSELFDATKVMKRIENLYASMMPRVIFPREKRTAHEGA